ncbi:hypothetical protein FHG55_09390 [Pseudomonas jessenii]|uniref:Uncharacterized protein n=1 Tax=Pseudomonas jessenii TaxID=77298 RepID=A0A5C4KZY1_PSEJE|nr:hypothetical protein FHG55_09390 [Pseudomonas jessenii]
MARELAPAGSRSGPALKAGLLRSPTGASSLATKGVLPKTTGNKAFGFPNATSRSIRITGSVPAKNTDTKL